MCLQRNQDHLQVCPKISDTGDCVAAVTAARVRQVALLVTVVLGELRNLVTVVTFSTLAAGNSENGSSNDSAEVGRCF